MCNRVLMAKFIVHEFLWQYIKSLRMVQKLLVCCYIEDNVKVHAANHVIQV